MSDEDLVAAVRRGEGQAFEELYRRYQPRVRGYALRMLRDRELAEEIAQEAFISALRRLRRTDARVIFKPWIHEIAKNAAIDHVRAKRRRGQEVCIAEADAVSVTAEAVVEGRQALADLQGAFGGLTEAHHQIIVLRELEGLSYAAIGERLGMSRAQVESTLFRARRRLEEEYQQIESGERCRTVQETLSRRTAAQRIGVRDQHRLERHIAHCRRCRREAVGVAAVA